MRSPSVSASSSSVSASSLFSPSSPRPAPSSSSRFFHLLPCSNLSPFLLLLILLISFSPHHPPLIILGQELAKCRNIQQACAAQILHFPALPTVAETVPDVPLEERLDEQAEGSGEGEAEAGSNAWQWHFVPISAGRSFPLYDEFVPTTPSYDYNAEPTDRKVVDICSCPDDQECTFEQEDRTVEFSPHVRVAFCRPLEEVFKLKCKGARTLARVIGSVDRQTNDLLSNVNDTIIFCRCESGRWGRVMVEPWLKHFSFSYKCLGN